MGPVANTLSDGLTNLFQAIMNFNPIVFGLVLGILWQVLVMFGMHWALVPLAILDVATNGSSIILSAVMMLGYFGWTEAAALIEKALENSFLEAVPLMILPVLCRMEPPSLLPLSLVRSWKELKNKSNE